MLVVVRGPSAGARFLLDRDVITIGRHPDADLFLDDVTVSRNHAEIHRTDTGLVLHDLGSLNGTYVSGARVDEHHLETGDEVQVGRFKLVYVGSETAVSHSIGEVLNRLKDEFDDITISKIRFLEAEGLINPDRTESGYRKFADADIDRLRYVLRAQRDRYLPLKVIKDELDRIDAGLPVENPNVGSRGRGGRHAAGRGRDPRRGHQPAGQPQHRRGHDHRRAGRGRRDGRRRSCAA